MTNYHNAAYNRRDPVIHNRINNKRFDTRTEIGSESPYHFFITVKFTQIFEALSNQKQLIMKGWLLQ